jgi:large subunit ribosomal protein L13e
VFLSIQKKCFLAYGLLFLLLNILIGNMVKHNNVLQSSHLRKHWQRRVKCFFNKTAHKKIRADRRAEKAKAQFPRPLSKLRPLVQGQTRKYAGKVKFGRGFTLEELKMAKLTPAFAATVGICVDHRRHNKSADMQDANVKRLNDYKAKLILFPRHEGKVKKGEINDSTAEKVKSAAQNTTSGVFALPALTNTVAVQPITKEMKSAKIYQQLRTLRTNAKYNGKRVKKALDAEREKK